MEKQITAHIEKKYNVNCMMEDIKSEMNCNGDNMESFEDYWREIEMSLNTRSCADWELTALRTLVKNQLYTGL